MYPKYLLQIISDNYLSQTITIQPKPSTPLYYTPSIILSNQVVYTSASSTIISFSPLETIITCKIFITDYLRQLFLANHEHPTKTIHCFMHTMHHINQDHSLFHIRYTTLSNQVVHSSMSPTIISSSLLETIITSKIFITNFQDNYLFQTTVMQAKSFTPSYTIHHTKQSSSTHLGVSDNNLCLSAWNNYSSQSVPYEFSKIQFFFYSEPQPFILSWTPYIKLSGQTIHTWTSATIISSSPLETQPWVEYKQVEDPEKREFTTPSCHLSLTQHKLSDAPLVSFRVLILVVA